MKKWVVNVIKTGPAAFQQHQIFGSTAAESETLSSITNLKHYQICEYEVEKGIFWLPFTWPFFSSFIDRFTSEPIVMPSSNQAFKCVCVFRLVSGSMTISAADYLSFAILMHEWKVIGRNLATEKKEYLSEWRCNVKLVTSADSHVALPRHPRNDDFICGLNVSKNQQRNSILEKILKEKSSMNRKTNEESLSIKINTFIDTFCSKDQEQRTINRLFSILSVRFHVKIGRWITHLFSTLQALKCSDISTRQMIHANSKLSFMVNMKMTCPSLWLDSLHLKLKTVSQDNWTVISYTNPLSHREQL